MGIQSICKVKASVRAVTPTGTQETAVIIPYFFRGSNVYKGSAAIKTASKVEHIPQQYWDGDVPLTPVADLIRAGIVSRVSVVVKNTTTNKKRKYSLVVDTEQLGAIYDGVGANNLINTDFILTNRAGAAVNMGKIVRLIQKTDAYHP